MAPKKDKAAAAAAKLAAERQAAAENAFASADADGSGNVDATELQGLLMNLLQREGIDFDRKVVAEFVSAEFSKADTDGSGDVDFDEFIGYYNGLIDRITGGAMNESLEAAKKATLKKLEEEAIAEDEELFKQLYGLLGILSSPSVKQYAGLVVPFQIKQLRETTNPEAQPNPEHGSCSRGFILDLSRRAQRLLTPWGSLPIGYRLSFPGYQGKVPPVEEEDPNAKKGPLSRAKKSAVPWPLVPANPDAIENKPMVFDLAKPPMRALPGQPEPPPPLLRLRKLPLRCHYQVLELLGKPVPQGETQALTGSDVYKKLKDRWEAQIKKNPKDPNPVQLGIPPEDAEGGPLVNLLLRKCVCIRVDRLESLKKRKEVSKGAAYRARAARAGARRSLQHSAARSSGRRQQTAADGSRRTHAATFLILLGTHVLLLMFAPSRALAPPPRAGDRPRCEQAIPRGGPRPRAAALEQFRRRRCQAPRQDAGPREHRPRPAAGPRHARERALCAADVRI